MPFLVPCDCRTAICNNLIFGYRLDQAPSGETVGTNSQGRPKLDCAARI